MRFIVALSALLLALAGHAEVKRPGTFVASLCSEAPQRGEVSAAIVAVDRVCFGKIVKGPADVLLLVINDGSTRTYKLTIDKKIRRMGMTKEPFTGRIISYRGSDKIAGEFVTASGITVTHRISLETDSGLQFKGTLRPMRVSR